jgi:hypothetical protein
VYLTPEQAAATATFNFAYQNAIVVAPEDLAAHDSDLNNRIIGEQSSRHRRTGPSNVSFPVPPQGFCSQAQIC